MLEEKQDRFRVDSNRRLLVMGGGLGTLFSILSGRLFLLQVMKGGDYQYLADDNRISVQPVPAIRGRILDRFNRVLAENRPDYRLSVIPELAGGVAALLNRLRPFLELTDDEIRALLRQAQFQRAFLPIQVRIRISWEQLSRIEARVHALPGVIIQTRAMRFYPQGNHGTHILGYLGEITRKDQRHFNKISFRSGDMVGKAGVERQFETFLRGREGVRQMEVNAIGRQVREVHLTPAQPGHDLSLTLDLELQKQAETALGDFSGSVVALDPNSGEVLAMASQPAFDPNLFIRGFTHDQWNRLMNNIDHPFTNKAVQGQYPPGSTFKIVVVMAAMAEGKISPHDRFTCRGFITRKDHRFYCWNIRGHGRLDLLRAIAQSCDVFFYQLAERVGIDAIERQALRMGLGRVTGIGLPGEKPGLVPSKSWKRRVYNARWYPGETLITAIGQGYLLATPLQKIQLSINTYTIQSKCGHKENY